MRPSRIRPSITQRLDQRHEAWLAEMLLDLGSGRVGDRAGTLRIQLGESDRRQVRGRELSVAQPVAAPQARDPAIEAHIGRRRGMPQRQLTTGTVQLCQSDPAQLEHAGGQVWLVPDRLTESLIRTCELAARLQGGAQVPCGRGIHRISTRCRQDARWPRAPPPCWWR